MSRVKYALPAGFETIMASVPIAQHFGLDYAAVSRVHRLYQLEPEITFDFGLRKNRKIVYRCRILRQVKMLQSWFCG